MFYRSLRFVLAGCFWLIGCEAMALTHEMNAQYLPMTKPFAKPLTPTNTTFKADLRLPHPRSTMPFSQDNLRHQKIIKTFRSRWLENYLTIRPVQVPQTTNSGTPPATPNDVQPAQLSDNMRFQWKPAMSQAMTFLWIQHTFRFMTEPGTRAELRGPFFKDWFTSVRRTRGWRDGDPFIVNYIGHPMQGSVTNYIYVHNDPRSLKLEAGLNKAYFKSRLKAMLFSTIYSTQFELGPLSEAALGNVGLMPSRTSKHPSAFVDLVVTPTLGTAWMIGEETLDRLVVKRMETRVENRVVRILVRGFLNPSHSFANVLRGRWPWHRDGRRL